jgi:hypothetical protein
LKKYRYKPKEISILWLLGNDPKENAKETTSSLLAFVGANSITVNELGDTLDNCKVHISLLEEKLKQQKDQMEADFMQ